MPTLFLLGDDDAFVPRKVARAWASIIAQNPSIRIVRVPGAGHLPWLDDPERVVGEIRDFFGEARTDNGFAATA